LKVLSALLLMLIAGACATDNTVVSMVPALRETKGMGAEGDAADDPAIWVNPNDPAEGLILGTNKDEGLYVYNLAGEELQRMPVGLSNNVDLRGNLAVASDDGVNALSWFRIDPMTAVVSHVGDTKVARIEPYGICLGAPGGTLQTAVTHKDGSIDIWNVQDTGAGPLTIAGVRTIKLGSQVEGCVIDDAANRLFVGEEDVGLWMIDLATDAKTQIDQQTAAWALSQMSKASRFMRPAAVGATSSCRRRARIAMSSMTARRPSPFAACSRSGQALPATLMAQASRTGWTRHRPRCRDCRPGCWWCRTTPTLFPKSTRTSRSSTGARSRPRSRLRRPNRLEPNRARAAEFRGESWIDAFGRRLRAIPHQSI